MNYIMFHSEFYPTPAHVLDIMEIDCLDKVVYEPHGGKADIIKYCNNNGASQVLASEINDDLRMICSKHAQIIGSDFFSVTSEQISHVQMIVMNPPFSNADRHIKHAWEIAPEGCEIIALCNYETISNTYSRYRSELMSLISNYGTSQNLGDVFSTAERKTNVEVGLIRLFKPILSESFDYDSFFFESEDEVQQNGLMPYNDIRSIVNAYVYCVKQFDEFERVATNFNNALKAANLSNTGKATFTFSRDKDTLSKEQFAKELQLKSWSAVFNRMNMDKYITKGVMEDINKFISIRKSYPFTMRNVCRMLDIIVGTAGQTMNRAIIEAIDNMTKHTHENRYGVEGWKTNSGHLLNKKFIVERMTGSWNPLTFATSGYNYDKMNDLYKAISFVTGVPFEENVYNYKFSDFNKWHNFFIFEVKIFKKGTAHFKFKDLKQWEIINRAYAKAKGVSLPEKI